MTMPGILYYVGSGGLNRKQDVMAIQAALNAAMGNLFGIIPYTLSLTGIVDAVLLLKIKALQTRYVPTQTASGLLVPNDGSDE